ncbi:hypothetical protein R1sor_024119 [Riccia sorocarpa]|uniref:Uncharacterized protein n=1 Tax=Riccia sorocarpa TaxID=122646 RepID=A0ABD3GPQ6_9MARC
MLEYSMLTMDDILEENIDHALSKEEWNLEPLVAKVKQYVLTNHGSLKVVASARGLKIKGPVWAFTNFHTQALPVEKVGPKALNNYRVVRLQNMGECTPSALASGDEN